MLTFYVYFISKDARKKYKEHLNEIMDYIRFRNGVCETDITWNLGTLAKFASLSVSADSEWNYCEGLVWTNGADLVKELNEFFISEPYIFSQFEGYRFEDDCKNAPDWFTKCMNTPVRYGEYEPVRDGDCEQCKRKNGQLNDPVVTCESQMDPNELFGRNKSLS